MESTGSLFSSPDDRAEGGIGSYGYVENAGGWFFCASLPKSLASDGRSGTGVVTAQFQGNDIQGEAIRVTLDGEHTERSVFFLRTHLRPTGDLSALELIEENNRLRLPTSSASARVDQELLTSRLLPILEQASADHNGASLVNLLSRAPYSGRDTSAELRDRIFLEIDESILCPPSGVVLIGWLLARPGSLREIRLRSGSTTTRLKIENCMRVERPDVTEKVAKKFGFTDLAAGFVAFLPNAIEPGQTSYIEVETTDYEVGFKTLPQQKLDGLLAIKRILEAFDVEFSEIQSAFDNIVGPSVSLLNQHRLGFDPSVTEIEFGSPNPDPQYTVIVPLHGRIDYVEYQLCLLSLHEPFRAQELIFVLDDPAQRRKLAGMGEGLYERFKIPFRLCMLDRNLGFGPACNIGLARARGRFACFLNSDVFPGTPGWMELLIAQLGRNPEIGVIGPMLLFENGSVQHEGIEYVRQFRYANWMFPRHTRKGMKPAEGGGLKTCAAITAACMVFEAEFIRGLGGFDPAYVIGDFEDSDLCLRIRQSGRTCAVDRDVWLYHLERKSQSQGSAIWRRNLTLYNAWIHQQRWPAIPESAPPPGR